MKPLKRNSGIHEAQESHSAEECQINEPIHSHPDVDCGHTVKDGPGVGVPKYDGHDGVIVAGMGSTPTDDPDQDPGNGSGAE